MFEITKENLEKNKNEADAKKMFAKMLSEMMLQSEGVSEEDKLYIRIINKAQDISDVLHDAILEKYCNNGKNRSKETLKKVLEYLGLVELGIKQFAESTPLVESTDIE